MDKNEKEIILHSSNVQEFEVMMHEFKEAIDKMNEKYFKISECNIYYDQFN